MSTDIRFSKKISQPFSGNDRGKSDFHVDISKYRGGEFLFSTWRIKNSSEESNETSEEMFDAHVENVLFLKKVHSWEGVTETVHGSFLSVL